VSEEEEVVMVPVLELEVVTLEDEELARLDELAPNVESKIKEVLKRTRRAQV